MSPTPAQRDDGRRMTQIAITALATVAAIIPASAEAASKPPSAVCTNTFTATVTPGFTPKPGAGKLTSNGQTGTIECFGTIAGRRVTGPGTLGFVERHSSGSCRGHVGTGRVRLIIPTASGEANLVGRLSVRRTALTVRVRVRFPTIDYRGNGVIFPRLGDCASTPLEQVKVTMTGTLRERPAAPTKK